MQSWSERFTSTRNQTPTLQASSTKESKYINRAIPRTFVKFMCDFRLPSQCRWDSHSSGLLAVCSGNSCTLCNNPEERRSYYLIVIDDQQDATILVYLFIPNQLYTFQAMFSPIIRSNWLYLQLLILSTDIAAGWCHGWGGTAFHLIHDTSWQQYRWTISEAVNTFKYSW